MTEPNYRPGSLAASIWTIAQLFPSDSHYVQNIRTMADMAAKLEEELEQIKAEAQTEADARYQAEVAALAIQEDRDRLQTELDQAKTAAQAPVPEHLDCWWCMECRDQPPDVTFDGNCDRCGHPATDVERMVEDLRGLGWIVIAPEEAKAHD